MFDCEDVIGFEVGQRLPWKSAFKAWHLFQTYEQWHY